MGMQRKKFRHAHRHKGTKCKDTKERISNSLVENKNDSWISNWTNTAKVFSMCPCHVEQEDGNNHKGEDSEMTKIIFLSDQNEAYAYTDTESANVLAI